MYKYLFVFLILLTSCSGELLPSSQDIESHEYVHVFEAKNGFEILFDSGATKTVSEYHTSGSIVLNGSYFGVAENGIYYPAGRWSSKDVITGNTQFFGSIENSDPNLSHVVMIRSDNQGIFIVPNHIAGNPLLYFTGAETWGNPEKWLDVEIQSTFQAGPLILSGNMLQPLGDSWHAHGPHERTLIGKTQSGKVYFFIFEKPVTLPQVADIIVQDDRFTIDPITLLNLDGGPSTAYYDGENGFRENAKLPIIFLIRT